MLGLFNPKSFNPATFNADAAAPVVKPVGWFKRFTNLFRRQPARISIISPSSAMVATGQCFAIGGGKIALHGTNTAATIGVISASGRRKISARAVIGKSVGLQVFSGSIKITGRGRIGIIGNHDQQVSFGQIVAAGLDWRDDPQTIAMLMAA